MSVRGVSSCRVIVAALFAGLAFAGAAAADIRVSYCFGLRTTVVSSWGEYDSGQFAVELGVEPDRWKGWGLFASLEDTGIRRGNDSDPLVFLFLWLRKTTILDRSSSASPFISYGPGAGYVGLGGQVEVGFDGWTDTAVAPRIALRWSNYDIVVNSFSLVLSVRLGK